MTWQTCATVAALTDVNGRLLFVPRQDPYLDVGLHQGLDGLRHLVLQLVLNGRGAQQLQVLRPDVSESRREEKRSQSAVIRAAAVRPLERHVSEKHVRRDCVTRPAVIPPSSAALVYHVRKTTKSFFFSPPPLNRGGGCEGGQIC